MHYVGVLGMGYGIMFTTWDVRFCEERDRLLKHEANVHKLPTRPVHVHIDECRCLCIGIVIGMTARSAHARLAAALSDQV